jgi:hypothetical protein
VEAVRVGPVHVHPHTTTTGAPQELAPLLADARLATAKSATSLRRARRNGYTTIVTNHIPDMGWHFMNPQLTEFDVTKPPPPAITSTARSIPRRPTPGSTR